MSQWVGQSYSPKMGETEPSPNPICMATSLPLTVLTLTFLSLYLSSITRPFAYRIMSSEGHAKAFIEWLLSYPYDERFWRPHSGKLRIELIAWFILACKSEIGFLLSCFFEWLSMNFARLFEFISDILLTLSISFSCSPYMKAENSSYCFKVLFFSPSKESWKYSSSMPTEGGGTFVKDFECLFCFYFT